MPGGWMSGALAVALSLATAGEGPVTPRDDVARLIVLLGEKARQKEAEEALLGMGRTALGPLEEAARSAKSKAVRNAARLALERVRWRLALPEDLCREPYRYDYHISRRQIIGLCEAMTERLVERRSLPGLRLLAGRSEALCQAQGAMGLGRLGDRASVPRLTDLLRARSFHVRRWTARALGLIGPPMHAETLRALERLTADENPEVAVEAVRALGRIGQRAAVQRIVPHLTHVDFQLRGAAFEALSRLGDESVEPTLRAHLTHDNPLTRRWAAAALRALRGHVAATSQPRPRTREAVEDRSRAAGPVGEWPSYQHDAGNSGFAPEVVRPPLRIRWTRLFRGHFAWHGVRAPFRGPYVADRERLYLLDARIHNITHGRAIDAETGRDLWAGHRFYQGYGIAAWPFLYRADGGKAFLVVTSWSGGRGYDPTTGRSVGSQGNDHHILGPARLGTTAVAGWQGKLRLRPLPGFTKHTRIQYGNPKTVFGGCNAWRGQWRLYPSVVVTGDVLLNPGPDGLEAISVGSWPKPVWTAPVLGQPIAGGGRIYVPVSRRHLLGAGTVAPALLKPALVALDPKDGHVLWRLEKAVPSWLVYRADRDWLYAAGGTKVYILRAADGRPVKQFTLPEPAVGEIIITGNVLYCLGPRTLHALDATSGKPLWRWSDESLVERWALPPIAAGGRLFLLARMPVPRPRPPGEPKFNDRVLLLCFEEAPPS